MIDKNKLNDKIKEWNEKNPEKRQLNKKILSEKLGFSQVTFHNYVNGNTSKIPFEFIQNLCIILEIDASEIVN